MAQIKNRAFCDETSRFLLCAEKLCMGTAADCGSIVRSRGKNIHSTYCTFFDVACIRNMRFLV